MDQKNETTAELRILLEITVVTLTKLNKHGQKHDEGQENRLEEVTHRK